MSRLEFYLEHAEAKTDVKTEIFDPGHQYFLMIWAEKFCLYRYRG
jgi:hypothetical protein